MDDTRTLQVDGVATGGSESRQYFLLNPYVPVGSEYGGFTNCFICLVFEFAQVTSSFPLPSSLAAGDSGPFANMTYYNGEGGRDPPGTIVFGYGTTNYSVTADTATTKRVCLALGITNVTSAGANLADSAETDCYTVDVGGTALLVSVTMIWNKETLTFQ